LNDTLRIEREREREEERNMDDNDDDDGFQVNTTVAKESNVRLYLGGLPLTTNNNDVINEDSIRSWLKERLPNNVVIDDVEIKQGTNAKNTFALVELNSMNISIDDVIREIKKSECEYDGIKISIQREQSKNDTNNKKKKTTSKKNVMRRGATGRKARGGKFTGPSLTSKGWSKPSTVVAPIVIDSMPVPVKSKKVVKESLSQSLAVQSPIEEASECIASVVSSETGNATNKDDAINTALASTAATTMAVSSMLSSLSFGVGAVAGVGVADVSTNTQTTTKTVDFGSFSVTDLKMTDLLSDFGDADPDWKKKIVDVTKTDLVADLVEAQKEAEEVVADANVDADVDDDDNDNEDEDEDDEDDANTTSKETKTINISKLAIKGKAPIHISIESFGYVHGVPSRKQREKSGSPYTQPCQVMYIDNTITEPVPQYLAFHDGLRSGVIKRLMKVALLNKNEDNIYDDREGSVDLSQYTNFQDYCKKYITEKLIWKALIEAIEIGGHGYVSPITMNFQIGSELGRHRSVIAVEWIAVHLRSLLRKNSTNIKIGSNCSVSVGTIHRDIKKKIPNKKYKEDDDDYYDKNDHV
jgi:hypothetical protein